MGRIVEERGGKVRGGEGQGGEGGEGRGEEERVGRIGVKEDRGGKEKWKKKNYRCCTNITCKCELQNRL